MGNKTTLKQKGRYSIQYRGEACFNCTHPLDISDKYCPNCSQANSNKKLSIKDFFDEFFASLISYDSKLLQTLSALLTKPGKITRDYINGKRISYTNPFRFLLSLSIIYFLMLNFSDNLSTFDRFGEGRNQSVFDQNNNRPLPNNNSENAEAIDSNFNSKDEFFKVIDSLSIAASLLKRDAELMANPIANFAQLEKKSLLERFGEKRAFFNALMRKEKVNDFYETSTLYQMEATKENKVAFNAAISYSKMRQHPGSFFSSLISKLPFAIFFFIPIFTLFIWMAYIRKKYSYTEHLVFGFHIQSLLFILLIISFLIDAIFGSFSIPFFILIFAVYLFLAMWKFYGQGLFKTIVKYVFLNTIFFTLALFTIVILFAGSIFTY